MAAWDLRRLQMHLEKGSVRELYLLIGQEYFLLQEALQGLKAAVLAGGAQDFNFDQFIAGDDEAVKVRDTAEMLPMMSPRRLVIVRQIENFKEKDWEALEPILSNPVESTTLVLLTDKIDKRKKIFKLLEEKAAVVELSRPYENQLGVWIEYIAAKQGLKVQSEVSALLRQLVGASLTELNNELIKIRDFIAPKTAVESEDVLKVVSRSRANTVFDLTHAIGRRDRAMALQALASLLEQGQNEVGAVAMVARHLRILSSVKEGQRENLAPAQVCVRAGIPQFFLKDYQSQARAWPEEKIHTTLFALKETDKALKSSPISSHIWLENFIIKACEI